MNKIFISLLAVVSLFVFCGMASADQILPVRFEWQAVTEADTVDRAASDSDAVIANSYGDAFIIEKIVVDGWSKSTANYEIVLFGLKYGHTHTSGADSAATYGSGAKVVMSWPVVVGSSVGNSADSSQIVYREIDFSDLKEGGFRMTASDALIFGVQAAGGDYYSAAAGATDCAYSVAVWYRKSDDYQTNKYGK